MRFVSFDVEGVVGFGAVVGETVLRLDSLPGAAGDLKGYLADLNGALADIPADAEALPLHTLRLLPPVPNPGKVICVATNFHEPARAGKPDPDYPIVFTRFAESFTGHECPLIKPNVSDCYDFEGELAVIIGKGGYKIRAEDAMRHVAGYSCLNEGSVRDWQKHSTQFTPGKNFFRSGSIGPWLVTPEEFPEFASVRMQSRVNGEVKQEIGLDQMIFDIPWLIAYFSTFTPLAPGDIIATGTPSGFGSSRTPQEFLSVGDVVEIEITGIGTLRNVIAHDGAGSPKSATASSRSQA
jgi:2-keto-4-pentenoate hydratase/2-oxohepta-3-ene-1,7-dioic acid hydratase in catechol pathway